MILKSSDIGYCINNLCSKGIRNPLLFNSWISKYNIQNLVLFMFGKFYNIFDLKEFK